MFQPSEHSYGAVDMATLTNLVGMGISAGTTIATTAINKGGKAPARNKKKQQQADLALIEASKPGYNPFWVVAGAVVVVGGLGFVLLRKAA